MSRKPRDTSRVFDAADERHMRAALRLAARGAGRTSPNPMVGTLIVRRGRVLASGWHHRAGEVKIIFCSNGAQMRNAVCHIFKRTGIAATAMADTSIGDAPHGDTMLAQIVRQKRDQLRPGQIRAPAAAMNHHYHR